MRNLEALFDAKFLPAPTPDEYASILFEEFGGHYCCKLEAPVLRERATFFIKNDELNYPRDNLAAEGINYPRDNLAAEGINYPRDNLTAEGVNLPQESEENKDNLCCDACNYEYSREVTWFRRDKHTDSSNKRNKRANSSNKWREVHVSLVSAVFLAKLIMIIQHRIYSDPVKKTLSIVKFAQYSNRFIREVQKLQNSSTNKISYIVEKCSILMMNDDLLKESSVTGGDFICFTNGCFNLTTGVFEKLESPIGHNITPMPCTFHNKLTYDSVYLQRPITLTNPEESFILNEAFNLRSLHTHQTCVIGKIYPDYLKSNELIKLPLIVGHDNLTEEYYRSIYSDDFLKGWSLTNQINRLVLFERFILVRELSDHRRCPYESLTLDSRNSAKPVLFNDIVYYIIELFINRFVYIDV